MFVSNCIAGQEHHMWMSLVHSDYVRFLNTWAAMFCLWSRLNIFYRVNKNIHTNTHGKFVMAVCSCILSAIS
uniref:Uncharacterized protein n=1 Tax=Anguilla anguilla TaxID=7936 RepID=A0A0E9UT50_ANGAN